MKIALAVVLCALSPATLAASGYVKIISPQDGAIVNSADTLHVKYETKFAHMGDHVHLYIDGQDHETLRNLTIRTTQDIYSDGKWSVVSREMDGKKAAPQLAPGKHKICVGVVDKAHNPTGLEKCIEVTAQ